jgi:hypothetical protein
MLFIKIWKSKINGGALYYTVFIALVISLFLGFFILTTLYKNRYLEGQIKRDEIISNVYSGINLMLGDPSYISFDETKVINLYDEGENRIKIQKKRWGVFQIFISESNWRDFHYERIAFVGDDIFQSEGVALYLTDQGKYISLSGNSSLVGTCYIPKPGIRRASIEGKGFTNDKLIYGTQKISSKKLPEINSDVFHDPIVYLSGNKNPSDSLIYLMKILQEEELNNSFLNQTILVYSEEKILLDHFNLSGNIRIISSNSIEVMSGCILEDIILYAPVILVRSGFSGKLQAFAFEKIIIEENCSLDYPSVLGVIQSEYLNMATTKDTESTIIIDKNSTVSGCVLLYSKPNRAKLIITEQSEIYGQVYCNGSVEHKGRITGSLYCNLFTLAEGSSLYENHLLDAVIDFNSLSKHYVGLNIISGQGNKKIIKWLN